MQKSRGRRRGLNFTIRMTPAERESLDSLRAGSAGPSALGPWLVWNALQNQLRHCHDRHGTANPDRQCQGLAVPLQDRIILDLCGGSGSWSRPYADAGYHVVNVSLPAHDVRTFVPPPHVWGILAAPPCNHFSIARNGKPRDFVEGMACVNACLRLVWQCRPWWWALENPGSGLLPQFLGIPQDSFQPFEFGDPWTKRTALWGEFALPARGPFVKAITSAMKRKTAAERALTPPGFAQAFFLANP